MKHTTLCLAVLVLASTALVAGCGNKASDAPKTAEAVKEFKGGPPPPAAMAKIREQMMHNKNHPPGVPARS
ncbi:hypothetical protein [Armatimonas sp.]|uniref:hypothetical protein n=1 Tax=Armatimonas sp. TaxID=1872638 RepID=UPI00286A1768|nr:hypothetical protein [Armatimonas sp.]